MADFTQKWDGGTAPTELIWTSSGPDGLANGSLSALSDELDIMDAVDTSSEKILDVLFYMQIQTAAGSLAGAPDVGLYVGGTLDKANAHYPPANTDTLKLLGRDWETRF